MFERFTDRARRVLVLAQSEAQSLHHALIESHHVLLALLAEGSGMASAALKALNIPFEDLRKVVLASTGLEQQGSGSGRPPQALSARHCIERAINSARRLGHNYVGTEHLLLALLSDPDGIARRALSSVGAAPEEVWHRTFVQLGIESDGWPYSAAGELTKSPGPLAPATSEDSAPLLKTLDDELERIRAAMLSRMQWGLLKEGNPCQAFLDAYPDDDLSLAYRCLARYRGHQAEWLKLRISRDQALVDGRFDHAAAIDGQMTALRNDMSQFGNYFRCMFKAARR